MEKYDVIIAGLGAVGSAALYQLSKLGISTLGIDQFRPPHARGSSHGDTQIARQATGEGSPYAQLATRSYQIWRELEASTGSELFNQCGVLNIAGSSNPSVTRGTSPFTNLFGNAIAVAHEFGIPHELLDARKIRERYPQFKIADDSFGYFEPRGGFLRPERCIDAQLTLAKANGASIRYDERILCFSCDENFARVRTETSEYHSRHLVLSVGAWLPQLIGQSYAGLFTVTRQLLFWFEICDRDIKSFMPSQCPAFILDAKGDKHGIYGFPTTDGQSVKIARQEQGDRTTADRPQQGGGTEEAEAIWSDFVQAYLPSLRKSVLKSMSCLYTNTADGGFVIDRHPDYPSVLVVSPCSGHGFKHSAAIGQTVAELISHGDASIDLRPFAFSRLRN